MRKFRASRRKRASNDSRPQPPQIDDELKKVQLVATAWAMFTIDLPAHEYQAANAVRIGEATEEQRAMFAEIKARRTPYIEGSFDQIHPGWREFLRRNVYDDAGHEVFEV